MVLVDLERDACTELGGHLRGANEKGQVLGSARSLIGMDLDRQSNRRSLVSDRVILFEKIKHGANGFFFVMEDLKSKRKRGFSRLLYTFAARRIDPLQDFIAEWDRA